MKIKIVFARIAYNPEVSWTEYKTVEVEIPDIDFGAGEYQYKLVGAEYKENGRDKER